MLKQLAKKALRKGAFFSFMVFIVFAFLPVNADNCVSSTLSKPERATVKWVYDGDSLLLTDTRKIRIIGIDTPETKHHKQKAQAYGAKAREALRALLKDYDYHITLRYGKERKDRYDRTLAHVYLPDGTNISNWLLERGFAKTLAYPPNTSLAACYKKSEETAQAQLLRIWRYKGNQVKDAASLPRRVNGYVRLKGTITNIKHYRKSLILELDSDSNSHIQIKIKKRYLAYFKEASANKINPEKLWNKTIIATGILKNKKGKRTIYVSHPTQISMVDNITTRTMNNRQKLKADAHLKWSLENESK